MNSTEIRIGNKIMINATGEWEETVVDIMDLSVVDMGALESKGIPITDDILLGFGFRKHKSGASGQDMWAGMDGWSLGDSEWLFRGQAGDLKLAGFFDSKINYVHQLQNLYFSLTDEELKSKP